MKKAVSLRDHFEMRLLSIEKSILYEHDAGKERDLAYKTQSELVATSLNLRFHALDQREALAREVNNTRLESMNEFRDSINDLINRMITRLEVEARLASLISILEAKETRLAVLETKLANFEGRLWAISGGVGLISLVATIVLHFLH